MIKGLTPNLEVAFIGSLPSLACVSDNFKRDGIERKRKHNAVTYRNIQHNSNAMIKSLCFDIDDKNGLFQWDDNNCLAPNWVTVNRNNGHAHYGYMITSPVSKTFKSQPKPQLFLSAVYKGMALKLGSDKSYSAFMTKNPLHEDWDTFTLEDKPYELNELADNFELVWGNKDKSLDECGELGRHQTLFNKGRIEIYKITQRYRTAKNPDGLEVHTDKIFQQMNNSFNEPLPEKQVYQLAKSVANWCYRKYVGDGKDRGVMELASKGYGLTMKGRQSLGATYSHDIRKQGTEQKIREAVAYLKTSGRRVSINAVAIHTGMSKSGLVRNYGDFIRSL